GLGFLQKPDDLLFRKALLHVRLLLRKRTLLDSGWPCLQGAGQLNAEQLRARCCSSIQRRIWLRSQSSFGDVRSLLLYLVQQKARSERAF
ncbi:hypothetical protein KTF21_29950, partial [Burkholderia multivorans]|uniref:hypothetical protein n=1 Tax=Burkholderia multivorans TaxID=87883 RepID=UPI001C22CA78